MKTRKITKKKNFFWITHTEFLISLPHPLEPNEADEPTEKEEEKEKKSDCNPTKKARGE